MIRELFEEHVRAIESKAESGDEFALKTLACMALLIGEGRPPDDGGGETVVYLDRWRSKLAA